MSNKIIKTINQNRQVKSAINPKALQRNENVISGTNLFVKERPQVIQSLDITNMAVWDDPTTTWDGLDADDEWDSYDESSIGIIRVFNKNNLFRETFDYDFFKGPNNTATWDTTNREVTFTAGQVLEMVSAFKDSSNSQTVVGATLGVTIDSGSFDLEMSANGGTNWESVTNNSSHTFTNTGSDLRIRATKSNDTSFPTAFGTWGEEDTGTITKIVCVYTLGA